MYGNNTRNPKERRARIYNISKGCKYDIGYSPLDEEEEEQWLGVNCNNPGEKPHKNEKCEYPYYNKDYSVYKKMGDDELYDSKLECAYTKYNWDDPDKQANKEKISDEKKRKRVMLTIIQDVCKKNKIFCSKTSLIDGTDKEQDERCLIENSCGEPFPSLSDFLDDIKDFYKVIMEILDFSSFKMNIDSDKATDENKEEANKLRETIIQLKKEYQKLQQSTPTDKSKSDCNKKKGILDKDVALFESEFHKKTKDCFTPAEKKIIKDYIYNRDKIAKINPTIGNKYKRIKRSASKFTGSMAKKMTKNIVDTGRDTRVGKGIQNWANSKKKKKSEKNTVAPAAGATKPAAAPPVPPKPVAPKSGAPAKPAAKQAAAPPVPPKPGAPAKPAAPPKPAAAKPAAPPKPGAAAKPTGAVAGTTQTATGAASITRGLKTRKPIKRKPKPAAAAKSEVAKQQAAKQQPAKQQPAKQQAAKQQTAKQQPAKQQAAKQQAAKPVAGAAVAGAAVAAAGAGAAPAKPAAGAVKKEAAPVAEAAKSEVAGAGVAAGAAVAAAGAGAAPAKPVAGAAVAGAAVAAAGAGAAPAKPVAGAAVAGAVKKEAAPVAEAGTAGAAGAAGVAGATAGAAVAPGEAKEGVAKSDGAEAVVEGVAGAAKKEAAGAAKSTKQAPGAPRKSKKKNTYNSSYRSNQRGQDYKNFNKLNNNTKKECTHEDFIEEIRNKSCSNLEQNDCTDEKSEQCPIHCCLRKILTKKRRALQEQKKDLQNKKNNSLKINNNVTIKELDNKLSKIYKDNPTQRVSLIKDFIEKRKLSDNDVLFYKGLAVTEEELKDCNTNTKCKLTPKLAQEYLSKQVKRKKISNTSRTPILPTTLLNEIKKKKKKIIEGVTINSSETNHTPPPLPPHKTQ
jgi:hypothetical protein